MFNYYKRKQGVENSKFNTICDRETEVIIHSEKIDGYRVFKNSDEIIEWTKENYKDFDKYIYKAMNSLEVTKKNAIYQYTGSVHIKINTYLRGQEGGKDEHRDRCIEKIDEAMLESNLIENIIAFRIDDYSGIKYKHEKIKVPKKGDIITDKAFLSTTILHKNRIESLENESERERCFIIIKVPAGTKCISNCNISSLQHEYELIIDRNCKLNVEEILYRKDRNIIMLCKVLL